MKSLKTKFILAITSLIIVTVLGTASVLVHQKILELKEDIFLNARSFTELSAPKIVSLIETSFKDKNAIFFTRDINSLLKNNTDISNLRIYDFNGVLLFDAETEKIKFYQGPKRQTTDTQILNRIKSANFSAFTNTNIVYFFQKITGGEYQITDTNSVKLNYDTILSDLRSTKDIIFPLESKYAVQYEISYQNLVPRIVQSAYQIIVISLIAILISIGFGYLLSSIVTRPLKKLTSTVEQIAKGDFKIRANVNSNDEVGVLADSVNHMAEDLEKSTEARVYKARLTKELEIAAKIQRELLPQELPVVKGLDLAAEVIPATEIGGDVYDVLIDNKGTPFFYAGDVTGHGIPAGLLSSVTNAIITSTIEFSDLIDLIVNLNHVIKHKSLANIFITVLLATYKGGVIKFVSAGHEKAIYYSAKNKKAEFLAPGGIALGLFEEIKDKLVVQTQKLEKGDMFLIYTDGIPEAWKSDTEQLGDEYLLKLVDKEAVKAKSAKEFKDALLKAVKNYMNGYEQKDDITLMVIRRS